MTFCEDCGSYLKETKKGYWCPRCRELVHSKPRAKLKTIKKEHLNAIYVIDKNWRKHARSSERCPACGNERAFYWISSVSGEHAGVRRERTVEHFRCAKCSHSWTRSH